MKNKIINYGFRYSFRRQILLVNPSTMPELIMPSLKLERNDDMVENIQRWEDDGGGIIDEITSTTEKYPVQPIGHDQSISQDLPEKRESQ